MILQYNRTGKDGKQVKYYTHSAYLDQGKVQEFQNGIETRKSMGTFFGILGFAATFAAVRLPAVRAAIPAKIPTLVSSLAGSFLIGNLASKTLVSSYYNQGVKRLIETSTVPLWNTRAAVINPSRAFFENDENGLNLNHHGMSPDRVNTLYPTFFNNAPKEPSTNSHGHDSHAVKSTHH